MFIICGGLSYPIFYKKFYMAESVPYGCLTRMNCLIVFVVLFMLGLFTVSTQSR